MFYFLGINCFKSEMFDKSLTEKVTSIVRNHYTTHCITTNIVLGTNKSLKSYDFITEVLKILFQTVESVVEIEEFINLEFKTSVAKACVLILTNDSDELLKIIKYSENSSTKAFDYRGMHSIVFIGGKTDKIGKIFSKLWMQNIYKVLTLYERIFCESLHFRSIPFKRGKMRRSNTN